MFNAKKPELKELPTTKQLIQSSIIAGIVAIIILFTVILPAEYGVDPTGVGSVLGLTKMGEIKQSLAEEAREEKIMESSLREEKEKFILLQKNLSENEISSIQLNKEETVSVVIENNKSIEIKVTMAKGNILNYSWTTIGGGLNYNVHGDSFGEDKMAFEYSKGLNKTEKKGSIVAVFNGTHGWFWRNRSGEDVTLDIIIDGAFSDLKKW